jgi:hypothetical protein
MRLLVNHRKVNDIDAMPEYNGICSQEKLHVNGDRAWRVRETPTFCFSRLRLESLRVQEKSSIGRSISEVTYAILSCTTWY